MKLKQCSNCGCPIPKYEQPAYKDGRMICKHCFERILCWNTGKNKHGVRKK